MAPVMTRTKKKKADDIPGRDDAFRFAVMSRYNRVHRRYDFDAGKTAGSIRLVDEIYYFFFLKIFFSTEKHCTRVVVKYYYDRYTAALSGTRPPVARARSGDGADDNDGNNERGRRRRRIQITPGPSGISNRP